MSDFLRLPHLRTLRVQDEGDHYRVQVTGQGVATKCPACGYDRLHGHGKQSQQFMDTPMHGKRVLIDVDRRRFRCQGCGKTLFSSLPDMDGKRLATTRLIHYLEQRCLTHTFSELGRQVGVDERTVRHVFDDYVDRLHADVKFETPEVLGIDELKIIGQYRAMITNVEKLSLYDMLPTRKKADLLGYFKRLPDKDRVKVVTMDLWSVYRQVAQAQLPGRLVVADRWHVLRMANDAMERTRKDVRRTLDTRTRLKLRDDRFVLLARQHNLDEWQQALLQDWSQRFPVLGAAYQAKEAFHNLYACQSRQEAEKAADKWRKSIPVEVRANFKDVVTALGNWWDEIFNWYDYPISNAYTESINRLAKDMNRMGRGYSFDVIRARLVFDEKARRPTSKVVRPKPRKGSRRRGAETYTYTRVFRDKTKDEPRVIEYGPHIPTLCGLLEEGRFEG